MKACLNTLKKTPVGEAAKVLSRNHRATEEGMKERSLFVITYAMMLTADVFFSCRSSVLAAVCSLAASEW
jgi:hypothetical protein